MKLVKTNVNEGIFRHTRMYNSTKCLKLLEEFARSGETLMEVTDWEGTFKKNVYASNCINKAAKHFGYIQYHAHAINGRVYLKYEPERMEANDKN